MNGLAGSFTCLTKAMVLPSGDQAGPSGADVPRVSWALRWVTLKVAGPLMADIVTGPNAPSSLHPAEVIVFVGRAFSLTLVPLLLWFGFVNHRSSERTVRRIFQQAAAIALLIMTGIILAGGVLTFYELRSR